MTISEALMLAALVPLPLLGGAALGWSRRPFWWAAGAAVALFNIAAIAPPSEPGQPRVTGDDVLFLVVCSAIIVGVAAAGYWAGRGVARLVNRRRGVSEPREPGMRSMSDA